MRDNLCNIRPGGPHEDALTTINNTSRRIKDKKKKKKEIENLDNE